MKTVTIFGIGDDLIEIDGDLGRREFAAFLDKTLLFSNGCRVRVSYDPEEHCWRTELLTPMLCSVIKHSLCSASNDDDTDRLTIAGDFEWVECWPIGDPNHDDLVEEIAASNAWKTLTMQQLLTVWRLLHGHSIDNLPAEETQ